MYFTWESGYINKIVEDRQSAIKSYLYNVIHFFLQSIYVCVCSVVLVYSNAGGTGCERQCVHACVVCVCVHLCACVREKISSALTVQHFPLTLISKQPLGHVPSFLALVKHPVHVSMVDWLRVCTQKVSFIKLVIQCFLVTKQIISTLVWDREPSRWCHLWI